jgi:arginine decarboxylase
MLAPTLGIDLDADEAWNERRKVYKTCNLIVDTLSMTAAAEGAPHGWTCVVAAAVFRFA